VPMNDEIRRALARGHTIDITTTGRRSGLPRRVEIVFHNIDGRLIITGSPRRRKRAWLLNLEADPRLTFHLKRATRADLPATARVITNEPERRAIAGWVVANAWPSMDVEPMVSFAPMIEVTIEDVIAA
ncbi:MAG TPA: nitroreductase family deazaflavin-dependent oxidoreductase, partial [Clostridia bacterium]|nr:nitroreductase family deazaflavin-dependent oxidoreductase [Clostridia bacterium]